MKLRTKTKKSVLPKSRKKGRKKRKSATLIGIRSHLPRRQRRKRISQKREE